MRQSLIIVFILLSIHAIPQAKRGLSLIEKEKYDQAYNLLIKAVNKDTLACEERFVLSQLFMINAYSQQNIDSAYSYILEALRILHNIKELNDKLYSKVNREGFGNDRLLRQKASIDSVGFFIAAENGTENAYNKFLHDYPTANEKDSATMLRNRLAFSSASLIHTFKSYRVFFTKYPQAPQSEEAISRYELLLYQAKTARGKRMDYQNFINTFPDSPYRQEALDHLFAIETGGNRIEDYISFIERHDESRQVGRAADIIYHLTIANHPATHFPEQYPRLLVSDSLHNEIKAANEFLIPTRSIAYQFMDTTGAIMIDKLQWVSRESRCEFNNSDVLLVGRDGTRMLISQTNKEIIRGDIRGFHDEGNGFLKIFWPDRVEIIHKSGRLINNHQYKDVRMVGPYLSFKQGDKWGLASVTGIEMIKSEYDSIGMINDMLIFQNKRKFGIHDPASFLPALDGDRVDVVLAYSGIEVLDSMYLVFKVRQQSLLDSHLQTIVPFGKQSIESIPGGYFIYRDDSIFQSTISSTWYQDIQLNERWIVGKKPGHYEIIYGNKQQFIADSAGIIGNTGLIVKQQDSTFLYFTDSILVSLSNEEQIIPLPIMGASSHSHHFMIIGVNNDPDVVDENGNKIELPDFDKIYNLGSTYLLLKYDNKFSIVDKNGQTAIGEIDGATSLGNGFISLFKAQKFGLFNLADSVLIDTHYNRPLILLPNELLLASKGGKYGIVSLSDSLIIPFEYDEIRYLDNTYIFGKKELRWNLINLKDGKTTMNNISDYWITKTDSELLVKVLRGVGYGIVSSVRGIILHPTFSEITILNTQNPTIYLAEKAVEEADLVVLIYYDASGKSFHKQVLETEEYNNLKCTTSN